MASNVHHPVHYNAKKYEVIDIMEEFFFNDGMLFTALKYLLRAYYKGHFVEDLQKCIWYIERRIEREERANDIRQKND